MKEEVYSYIVSSIHLLNQSLKKQNTQTVQLFSYMYNNYCDITEQIQNSPDNKDIQFLSYCIVNLDNKTKKIFNKTKIIDENINSINDKLNTIITYINTVNTNTQKNPEESRLFKFYKYIENLFYNLYKKIYNFIFQKRIKREIEEQRQREIELENQKKLEKQRLIRNILNGKK